MFLGNINGTTETIVVCGASLDIILFHGSINAITKLSYFGEMTMKKMA